MQTWSAKFTGYILLSLIFFGGFATTSGQSGNVRTIPQKGTIVYPINENGNNIFQAPTNVYPIKIGRAARSHSFQQIELEEIAENFDLIFSFPEYFGSKIRDLKALNPDLIALVNRNFRAIYEIGAPDEYKLALDNGWILRDVGGNIVRSTEWTQNVMVDIGNPDYQDFVVNWIKETIDQYGYDGVHFDNSFSVGKLEMWFDLTAQPMNPRTGNEWTGEEIKQACIQVHNRLKETIGPKLDVPNGIYFGHRFWTYYDDYLDLITNTTVDGFMSEGLWFMYNGRWLTAQEWLESLDFLSWVQDNFLTNNRIFWIDCEVPRGTLPEGCTYYQMIDYGFASTLLGAKSKQNYITFFSTYNRGNLWLNDYVKNLHNLTIGKPLKDYYQIEGTYVYSRDFTNVKVLVNPTETSYTVDLSGIFETLAGEKISIITLTNHTGAILKVSD